MGEPTAEQQERSLLVDLPGPAFQVLWSSLNVANDKLSLLQTCRDLRDRVLSTAQAAAFCTPAADVSPGAWALLQALLRRPLPLRKLTLGVANKRRGRTDALKALLHALASAHGAAAAEPEANPVWHGAAGVRELELLQLTITAGAAALLHSAFPQLSTLKLTCCRMDTAAVAKALCSCPHLTHLTLVDPCHLDPEGLWAAAEAGAAAAGQLELLQAAAGVQDNPQETKAARSAAATGYLLRQLPATVTSLKLSMHWVLATFRLMVLKGLGRRLQELCMHQSESLTYPHMYILSTLIPALQACAGLASLEIGGIWAWQLCGALARCGTWAALRSLSLPQQTVGEALLEVFLENMPALEHVSVGTFELKDATDPSWATGPCSWRSLQIALGCIDVATLFRLPLHTLTQPIDMGTSSVTLACDCAGDAGRAAAMVQAAQANLARYTPGLFSVLSPYQLMVNCYTPRCPSILRLLSAFPSAETLCLIMQLGAEELACLAEAGSFCSGVQSMVVGLCCQVQPGFLTTGLWEVLPALSSIRFLGAGPEDTPVEQVVECLAAAPHPVTITYPSLWRGQYKAELAAALAALPVGKVQVVEESGGQPSDGSGSGSGGEDAEGGSSGHGETEEDRERLEAEAAKFSRAAARS